MKLSQDQKRVTLEKKDVAYHYLRHYLKDALYASEISFFTSDLKTILKYLYILEPKDILLRLNIAALLVLQMKEQKTCQDAYDSGMRLKHFNIKYNFFLKKNKINHSTMNSNFQSSLKKLVYLEDNPKESFRCAFYSLYPVWKKMKEVKKPTPKKEECVIL